MLKGSALLVLYAAAPACAADSSDSRRDSSGVSGVVPDPDRHLVTRWRADPFARGSYSYLAVGSSPADRRALAEPVDGRLFFAGEATSVAQPATVPGAFLSGQAAAAAIDDVANEGAGVLVIGAGVAGLAAARSLVDRGYPVTVIEGRNRIGGRTWTDRTLGPPVDLGASWIQGTEGNPVAELIDELGIETAPPTEFDDGYEYDPGGEEYSDGLYGEVGGVVDLLLAAAAVESEERAEDAPLGTVLEEAGASLDVSPDVELAVRHYFNTTIEHEYAGPLDDLSVYWWEEGEGYGGDNLLLPGGYGQLVDALADGLTIETDEVVRRVALGFDGVNVETDRNTFGGDHVVVTLPLGVLKAGTVEFDPPIPAAKSAAIGRLGMGLLDKLYLRFPEVFWDTDADVIGWTSPDGDGRWGEWVNMAKVTGEPILLGFNAADYAQTLEAMTDDEIVADAMDVLRTIYDR